jgi:hypothetical protein
MIQELTMLRRLASYLKLLPIVLMLSAPYALHAQVAGTGSIQGTITDTTDAVIPDASVTLTEESTQVRRTTKADGKGVYAFPNISIGTYTETVSAPGFKSYTKTGNVLEVGGSISINVKMTIGEASEKIEVKADALALQTEDASYKQTIDQQDITEMPLNSAGRQITGLLAIAGGTNPAPGGDFTGSKYSYQTIAISIAGGQGNTTLWRLDGGDNNDYMANGNLPFPFPDAVAQFSVESTAPTPIMALPLNLSATTTWMRPISFPPARRSRPRRPVQRKTLCTRTSTAARLAARFCATGYLLSPDINT